MALKGDRKIFGNGESIRHFMNAAGKRGGIVMVSSTSAPSGAALDQGTNLVEYAANPSGMKVAGMLLNDVVDINQSRFHRNQHKDEVQKGGKVAVATYAELLTDQVASGITVAYGQDAYVSGYGRVTNVNGGAAATPKVGRWLSGKDEDGYALLEVHLT